MLDESMRRTFQGHIETGGLITAPETLLAATLTAVATWLQTREQAYRKSGHQAEANALRELRTNQLKTT